MKPLWGADANHAFPTNNEDNSATPSTNDSAPDDKDLSFSSSNPSNTKSSSVIMNSSNSTIRHYSSILCLRTGGGSKPANNTPMQRENKETICKRLKKAKHYCCFPKCKNNTLTKGVTMCRILPSDKPFKKQEEDTCLETLM